MARKYWLMKSEPDVYSFSDLSGEKNKTCEWEGVRNYQARNFMRDDMKKGDKVLFYHSRTDPPHIAGLAEVTKEGYPDHYSWDFKHKYFDAKSSPDSPRWFMVDICADRPLAPVISLADLKENPNLSKMGVVQKGQRLSVQPVERSEYEEVLRMEKRLSKKKSNT